jgi:hypothetical protein
MTAEKKKEEEGRHQWVWNLGCLLYLLVNIIIKKGDQEK